jgi:hypothetical protein
MPKTISKLKGKRLLRCGALLGVTVKDILLTLETITGHAKRHKYIAIKYGHLSPTRAARDIGRSEIYLVWAAHLKRLLKKIKSHPSGAKPFALREKDSL